MVNKMDDSTGEVKAFNRNDEQFLEAFAIFCGLGIQNTQMYETVERAMAKQEVTLEVGAILNIIKKKKKYFINEIQTMSQWGLKGSIIKTLITFLVYNLGLG